MRWSHRTARLWVASIVTLGLTSAPTASFGAEEPSEAVAQEDALLEELETLYARGEERFKAGDLPAAIEAFDAGLARIGPDGPERLRAYFSVSLAIAHLDLYERDQNETDLRRAHELLSATVSDDAEVLAREPRLEALARRNLARAQALVEPNDDEGGVAPFEETSDPTNPDGKANVAEPVPEDGKTRRQRNAGIGLLVSGTALVVGGVALFVDGATLESRARAVAEDPPQGQQKEYIEEEVPRLATIRYAIAGPLLAVGAGLLIGGAVLLHRAANPKQVVLGPALGPRFGGLTLRARF